MKTAMSDLAVQKKKARVVAASGAVAVRRFFPNLAAQTVHAKKSLIAASFGTLPAPETITKVVSAGPVPDVFLLSIAPEKLLGFATMNINRESRRFFPESIRNLPTTGRIVGRGSVFPVEKLIALKPDIIIDLGDVDDHYVSTAERVHRQTGIPYVLIDGTLIDSAQQIREVATILGVNERGKTLGDFVDTILADAARVRDDDNKKKISVFYGRGADGLETGLSGSIHTEVLDILGTRNAAKPAGEKLVGRVSFEQLMQWQPDVIVTMDANYYAMLKKGGVWNNLNAVKNKKFYLAPSKIPFGWLDGPPSINRVLGIIWMQRTLYPETIAEDYFHAQIQKYYKLFYDYDLALGDLKKILGDPEGWPTL